MNYTTLVSLTQQYVETDETTFIANIPNFVRLAEERIYRYVKVPNLRKQSTPTLTSGSPNLTIPADFVSPDTLEITVEGTTVHLIPKDHDFLNEAYPFNTFTGTPVFYAVFDNTTIKVAPTPDANYAARLVYTQKPKSIVDAGTNWLGDNAEQALLYGTIIEAYTYLKGEQDLLQLYEQRFMEAVGQVKVLGEGKLRTDEWRTTPPMPR